MEPIICKTPGCDRVIQPPTAKRNNGLCGPCFAAIKKAEQEEYYRQHRKDVNPYAGVDDLVDVLKIMFKFVPPNPMVNLLPYPEKVENIIPILSDDQIKRLVQFVARQVKKTDSDYDIETLAFAIAVFSDANISAIQKAYISIDEYPGEIFRNASPKIRDLLVKNLEAGSESWRLILIALAWIGDSYVISNFDRWLEGKIDQHTGLPETPDYYTHYAGWELVDGVRRDLFSKDSYPLVVSDKASTGSLVESMVDKDSICPYCGHKQVTFLDLTAYDISLGFIRSDLNKLELSGCEFCSCYTNYYMTLDENGTSEFSEQYNKASGTMKEFDISDKIGASKLLVSQTKRAPIQTSLLMWNITYSQIGGMPTWEQSPEYPICPECGETMPFIAQISNAELDNKEGFYYGFICTKCNITAVNYQQT